MEVGITNTGASSRTAAIARRGSRVVVGGDASAATTPADTLSVLTAATAVVTLGAMPFDAEGLITDVGVGLLGRRIFIKVVYEPDVVRGASLRDEPAAPTAAGPETSGVRLRLLLASARVGAAEIFAAPKTVLPVVVAVVATVAVVV